ncbi:hypothetical protein EPA93_37570 [Ktedonosporobacter rubrisoli]|uniref:Uncharacterized protein n=1 Tax=Ktedonosporobacter rubrisoli TaxID=2509675 RepID=A0A4P6K0R2_KTERU|nr:phosphoribosyltransferase family protein [Ktedonosporobacter rubrisoli]QBD81382.1 hypothetical protein EPA93_37570 [Ktedonosporobacter rubrisoli]
MEGRAERVVLQISIATMSLYQLHGTADSYESINSPQTFSPIQYSQYKYGAGQAGEAYAQELEEAFRQHFSDLVLSPRLIVASSPYRTIPPSSLCIAQAFLQRLNSRRKWSDSSPASLSKIGRSTLYPGDYGLLSAARRTKLMQGNYLSFEATRLAGADLVVIDDIKVTGAHQKCVMSQARSLDLHTLTFLYVIECMNSQVAAANPQIEDQLNHASIRTLAEVTEVIGRPDFFFNVRICKFILSTSNRSALPEFLKGMTDAFCKKLYRTILEDGYCYMDMYRESFQILHAELQKRRLLYS